MKKTLLQFTILLALFWGHLESLMHLAQCTQESIMCESPSTTHPPQGAGRRMYRPLLRSTNQITMTETITINADKTIKVEAPAVLFEGTLDDLQAQIDALTESIASHQANIDQHTELMAKDQAQIDVLQARMDAINAKATKDGIELPKTVISSNEAI